MKFVKAFIILAVLLNPSTTSFLCDDDSVNQNLGPSYTPTSFVYNTTLPDNCGCYSGTTCVRKCCQMGYMFRNKTCVFNNSSQLILHFYDNEVEIQDTKQLNIKFINGALNCKEGSFTLQEDEFFVQRDGTVREPEVEAPLTYNQYCLEYSKEVEAVQAKVCFGDEEDQPKEVFEEISTIGMLVSVPFLLATFIVYALLPQRKLHGNALMCYVISLLGGFALLAILRLKKYGFSEIACMGVVVPCIFFFLASFFWMNVMSIDIWWTFSGLGGFKGSRRASETKRFLIYSAYAWGAPFLLGIVIIALSTSPYVPPDAWYNPGVGRGTACWFRQALQELIFFYGPLSFLTIANVLLFAVTAYKIRQAQKDTAMLRKTDSQKHGDDSDAQRFSLYLKLLLVMGLNWTMEVVSYAVDWQVGEVPPAVWYITDFCNALYGVLIFFLFCFNKKTLKELKSRFNYGSTETSKFSTYSTAAETKPLNTKK